ncbi:MAG: TerB family tellurite resistance protein [Paracoccaceae bacterium]
MFDRLLKTLLAPAPEPLADTDARLALTALLVRIARSDNDYARAEVATIERILAARYGLDARETSALLIEAEALEAQAPDTVRFTRAIKEAVPHDDRLAVVESAWAVVLADGDRADEEDALMRMVASLLGINDRDSNIARLKVAGG